MMYGNSSTGYGYSPDRSRDVDRFNHSTRSNYSATFANASGSRQTGYWCSPKGNKSKSGEWKQSGSGAWYKD